MENMRKVIPVVLSTAVFAVIGAVLGAIAYYQGWLG